MKIVKVLIIFLFLLGGLGMGGYLLGTKYVPNKIRENVSNDIEKHGQIEEIKNVIKDDPEIKSFIEEGNIELDDSKLPFHTKEEAIMVLVEKIGVAKLVSMKSNYEKGTLSKKEVLQTIEENLSEEEITALQVVAFRELKLVGTGSLSH